MLTQEVVGETTGETDSDWNRLVAQAGFSCTETLFVFPPICSASMPFAADKQNP
jgi:hypothetical protein